MSGDGLPAGCREWRSRVGPDHQNYPLDVCPCMPCNADTETLEWAKSWVETHRKHCAECRAFRSHAALVAALEAAEAYLVPRVGGTGGVGDTLVLPQVAAALAAAKGETGGGA